MSSLNYQSSDCHASSTSWTLLTAEFHLSQIENVSAVTVCTLWCLIPPKRFSHRKSAQRSAEECSRSWWLLIGLWVLYGKRDEHALKPPRAMLFNFVDVAVFRVHLLVSDPVLFGAEVDCRLFHKCRTERKKKVATHRLYRDQCASSVRLGHAPLINHKE